MAKAILSVLVICSSIMAAAHDLYLVTGVRGADGKICARIGEAFPASTNALTPDRLEVFAARTNAGIRKLQGKVAGKQLCAPAPSNTDFVAEIVVQPRFIKLSSQDFDEYVAGEGLKEVIRVRAEQGANVEGRELYSRYAKLIGGRGQKASSVLGHVLEIVPEKDPAELKADEELPVRVLFRGKPLADAQVAAVYAGAKLEGHKYPVTSRTDSEGRATLKLDRPGLWYARLIHMVPTVDDPEVNWRSFFATVTFNVAQPSERR